MYIDVECKLSPWQSPKMGCEVVLYEVFAWLSGTDLARAGAACRAWRFAAMDPTHWRRLLRRVTPDTFDLSLDIDRGSWRQEYVEACAGWSLKARVGVAPGAGVAALHADLAPAGDALAVGANDASLALWRCDTRDYGSRETNAWREVWRRDLSAPRGWTAVARVQWAPRPRGAPRLLLAGPRALVRDWELMVVQLDEEYQYDSALSRVRCSAGSAAGCWAGPAGDSFLSLELELLGLHFTCTSVWLNAASQETQSEHTGVTTLLLRIFNEGNDQITHVLVAPTEGEGSVAGASERVLVAGAARGLAAWRVRPRLPRLDAGAPHELAERARRRREQRARPPHPPPPREPPEPDESTVRALCEPPARRCALPAPPAGLALHPSGAWLCASRADGGASCVCARSLTPLRDFPPPGAWSPRAPPAPPAPVHYVLPSCSDRYVASPAGAYSSLTSVWSMRTGVVTRCRTEGATGAGGAAEGVSAGGAATCALLAGPPHRPHLLVLAGAVLFVWHSRATSQP